MNLKALNCDWKPYYIAFNDERKVDDLYKFIAQKVKEDEITPAETLEIGMQIVISLLRKNMWSIEHWNDFVEDLRYNIYEKD